MSASSHLLIRDDCVGESAAQWFVREWRPAQSTDRSSLLLLHDSLGCVELWRDWPARLAEASGRRVIAYDRLGFGCSSPRHTPLPPSFVADESACVGVLLDQLGHERFIAVGHSVGGGMAVHAAAALSSRCEGLVTIAAQARNDERIRAGIRVAREQFKEPGQLERLARYHGEQARWVLNAWIETWLSPAFADWSLAPVLSGVQCPTLVIHGEQDEYGDASLHPRWIAEGVSGPAQCLLLPGRGHVPHREAPEEMLPSLLSFLKALR